MKKKYEKEDVNEKQDNLTGIPVTENKEDLKTDGAARVKKRIVFMDIVIFIIIVFVLLVALDRMRHRSAQTETEAIRLISVTGIDARENGKETKESETTTETEETENVSERMPETEDYPGKFFGSYDETVSSMHITVSGLDNRQKEKLRFRESDFVKTLSAFLRENGISAKKVKITDEIRCSADGAVAYNAEFDEKKDKVLGILFYPDYPGRYLFTLQDAREVVVNVQAQPQNAQRQQESPMNAGTQNLSLQVDRTQTEAAYDATRLSVNGIPEILINYLDNRYELQYTLYDYLYGNGYRDVTSADIESYDIDADARTATMQIALSNGQKITGIYRKEENIYYYY